MVNGPIPLEGKGSVTKMNRRQKKYLPGKGGKTMNIVNIFSKKKNGNTVNAPGDQGQKEEIKKRDIKVEGPTSELSKSERKLQLTSWFIAMR